MKYLSTEIVLTPSFSLDALNPYLTNYSKCSIITDEHLYRLHYQPLAEHLKHYITVNPIILPAGEQCKTLNAAAQCWESMHQQGLDRQSLVIGLGGGAITDLAGYVAGCYMRGIDAIFLPTSLLGMVDAAIGGKAGINLPQGKNLVGVYHHPKLVIMSMHYLQTLPDREFAAGLAEVIKYGVIAKPSLFAYLESAITEIFERQPNPLQMIIEQSSAIKKKIVEADEREHGLRSILNWGHTVGHALEAASDYREYLHGEAIAIGMCCEARISEALGFVGHDFVLRLEELFQRVGLPTKLPAGIAADQLIAYMRGDKKSREGKISMIIVEELGKVRKVDDIDEGIIRKVMFSQSQ